MSDYFTGKGDDGYTGLLGDERVPKFDPRPESYGTIDEAAAAIGLARSLARDERSRDLAIEIQRDLYKIMSEVAATRENAERFRSVGPDDVERLEGHTERIGSLIELPREFIVGGDTQAGAAFDLARTITRRAERRVAELIHAATLENTEILRYLNRLSSLLFLLVHLENRAGGVEHPSLASGTDQ